MLSYFGCSEKLIFPRNSVLLRSELRNGLFRGTQNALGMSTFFRGIMESVPSLFRGIFSERNSVANPNPNLVWVGMKRSFTIHSIVQLKRSETLGKIRQFCMTGITKKRGAFCPTGAEILLPGHGISVLAVFLHKALD